MVDLLLLADPLKIGTGYNGASFRKCELLRWYFYINSYIFTLFLFHTHNSNLCKLVSIARKQFSNFRHISYFSLLLVT
jgi:hypothetical protein